MRRHSPKASSPAVPVKAPASPVTVGDALAIATRYWEAKGPSSRAMPIRAKRVASIIGEERELDSLGAVDGTFILTELSKPHGERHRLSDTLGPVRPLSALSTQSQATYYAAFTRALNLAGVSTDRWPSGPTPPRRVREPLSEADLDALHAHFLAVGHGETATLLSVLRGTGMRVEVEALSWTAWVLLGWNPAAPPPPEPRLQITGKGGHQRVIPITLDTQGLLCSKLLTDAMRRLSYSGHLKRWNRAVKHLGIKSKLPTPHAVRHYYATRAYERSGKNLVAVQLLLGHADPGTTARYIGVDMGVLRDALGD